jgi:hypothetical protein
MSDEQNVWRSGLIGFCLGGFGGRASQLLGLLCFPVLRVRRKIDSPAQNLRVLPGAKRGTLDNSRAKRAPAGGKTR